MISRHSFLPTAGPASFVPGTGRRERNRDEAPGIHAAHLYMTPPAQANRWPVTWAKPNDRVHGRTRMPRFDFRLDGRFMQQIGYLCDPVLLLFGDHLLEKAQRAGIRMADDDGA